MSKLSYCIVCKKKTPNSNITKKVTSNGRLQQLSTCTICKNKKSVFLPKKKLDLKQQKGKGPIDFVLNNLPLPEMHLTDRTKNKPAKYNFCGPFTKLDKRLKRGDVGINELDEACKAHDISYNTYKSAKDRHPHDLQLARIAEKIANNPSNHPDLIKNANKVSAVMRGKVTLGLGKK